MPMVENNVAPPFYYYNNHRCENYQRKTNFYMNHINNYLYTYIISLIISKSTGVFELL